MLRKVSPKLFFYFDRNAAGMAFLKQKLYFLIMESALRMNILYCRDTSNFLYRIYYEQISGKGHSGNSDIVLLTVYQVQGPY